MSNSLRSRISSNLTFLIEELEETANRLPFDVLQQYEEAKRLFEDELPDENFHQILKPEVIVIVELTYSKKKRMSSKIKALENSSWALSEMQFSKTFGWEMLGSVRFLDNLLKLTSMVSFQDAFSTLKAARDDRRAHVKSHRGVDTSALWQPIDVQTAIDILAKPSLSSAVSIRKSSQKSPLTHAKRKRRYSILEHHDEEQAKEQAEDQAETQAEEQEHKNHVQAAVNESLVQCFQ